MRQIFRTYIYAITCSVMLLTTGCSTDSIIHDVTFPPEAVVPERLISFDMKAGNVTRSTQVMNKANHYEFGVFASQYTPYDANNSALVMKNYLVAYGMNSNYMPWLSQMQTIDSLYIDSLYSHTNWLYTTLGNNDPKRPASTQQTYATKSIQPQQIAKYWDKYSDSYYFYAYAPYMRQGDASQPGTVTVGNDSIKGEYIHFNGLRAFYTHPVEQTGITTGRQTATGFNPAEVIADDDSELINANEALYAANSLLTDAYLGDVALIFKHVNAKMRIAFWEDVDGYSVELLDLVPENVHITYGAGQSAYKGIALTPASHGMTDFSKMQIAKNELAPYYKQAQVRIKGIQPVSEDTRTNFSAIEVGNTSHDEVTRQNLRFATPVGVLGETKEKAVFSQTIYYPLPNYESTVDSIHRITDTRDGMQVSDSTGYTLHVTFRMHPVDESADITVYDARVFIPADKCLWEAGKQYTYIFKITTKANGTTNPNKPDPTDPLTPWVDPDDPRIPDGPALSPIVFDGVVIEEYQDGITSPEIEF